MNYPMYPVCDKKECFACEEWNCLILTKNDFGNKECPFFKTKEQVEEEREYCRKRMNEIRINNKENELC